MHAIIRLLGATLAGGVLFLVPIVLIVLAVSKILHVLRRLVHPVASRLPEAIAGVGAATLVSLALILLFCLLAGLAARTRYGRRCTGWFEDTVLGQIPQYKALSTATRGILTPEEKESLRIAAVRIEDAWQLGYVIDELDDKLLAVFIPEVPTPFSGSLFFIDPDRVRILDVPIAQAIRCIKRGGAGSRELIGRRLSE